MSNFQFILADSTFYRNPTKSSTGEDTRSQFMCCLYGLKRREGHHELTNTSNHIVICKPRVCIRLLRSYFRRWYYELEDDEDDSDDDSEFYAEADREFGAEGEDESGAEWDNETVEDSDDSELYAAAEREFGGGGEVDNEV